MDIVIVTNGWRRFLMRLAVRRRAMRSHRPKQKRQTPEKYYRKLSQLNRSSRGRGLCMQAQCIRQMLMLITKTKWG